MEQMKRYAIYYAPPAGAFAQAAAAWLGWDVQAGCSVAQPAIPLPRPLAEVTAEPRKYGFHGTIKPPFRLAEGARFADLDAACADMAQSLPRVDLVGLQMVMLQQFLALVPQDDITALTALAADIVQTLEPFRAPLTEAEIARRRPDRLTLRQIELLHRYGYPYVLEEFRFHLTLSGPLGPDEAAVTQAAQAHFAGLIPAPFALHDICLFGEDHTGLFHLLRRYPLIA